MHVNEWKLVEDAIITMENLDKNNLIIGSEAGQVLLIDLRSSKDSKIISSHREKACKVKYSKGSNLILSGGNDGSVQIFDTRAWKMIKIIKHNSAAVKAIDINENTNKIITGGGKLYIIS